MYIGGQHSTLRLGRSASEEPVLDERVSIAALVAICGLVDANLGDPEVNFSKKNNAVHRRSL